MHENYRRTQKAWLAYIYAIRDRYDLAAVKNGARLKLTGQDYEDLLELYLSDPYRAPNADVIEGIYLQDSSDYHTVQFCADFTDGKERDPFSPRGLIQYILSGERDPVRKVLKAFREAVHDQHSHRKGLVAHHDCICLPCLVKDFLASRGIGLENVGLINLPYGGVGLADEDLKHQWKNYHLMNSEIIFVSQRDHTLIHRELNSRNVCCAERERRIVERERERALRRARTLAECEGQTSSDRFFKASDTQQVDLDRFLRRREGQNDAL